MGIPCRTYAPSDKEQRISIGRIRPLLNLALASSTSPYTAALPISLSYGVPGSREPFRIEELSRGRCCRLRSERRALLPVTSGDYDQAVFLYTHVPPPFLLSHQVTMFYALLGVINTPGVFAGRDHTIGFTGKRKPKGYGSKDGVAYQLSPWTEILLRITPPPAPDEEHSEPGGTRLTGARALHFYREYLRPRNGTIERVRAHWRANPELGIKQSSYRVQP
ncbi:MAG: hypothetical protein JOY71_23460 [Acetobacteraceae bacterium]|nr:hypothetical protein [Acetobacteraceae bacterium]MBV8591779.1 hypothetical protein [Acetobacteraceae bacterium]